MVVYTGEVSKSEPFSTLIGSCSRALEIFSKATL